MAQKAGLEKKKKEDIPSLIEKGQDMGKRLLREKKWLMEKLLKGSIGKCLFSLHFMKKEIKKINAISKDFSDWMVYVCIKHKLEEHVWSLSVLNFKLFPHLRF